MRSLKKMAAAGLVGIMALGQSMAVFAAETYTVSVPVLAPEVSGAKQAYVSGTCTYKNTTGSNSYDMMDSVHVESLLNGTKVTYDKSGYGVNVATAMCPVEYRPYLATNTGYKKVNYSYVPIGTQEKKWN